MNEDLIFAKEEELQEWAYQLGELCGGTELILLTGELGAGKTTFTKGLARGLGIKNIVTSPTFTFLNIYEDGPLRLCHYDLYRIHSPDDLEALGFYDYLGEAVIAVEWAEKAKGAYPCDYIELAFFFHPKGRRVIASYKGHISSKLRLYLEKRYNQTTCY